ncbi:MAG: prolipoprotein diacylglyceryl transferase [Halobacteriovoraceae bacterium]|nr:prolipoprotein diacylglyceryl transferase [Halobacteriovoraceae bacterium]|tara:strand:- start:1932 stop:2744 length:813 start_codon:yes stop_codon:yes gene_type:complete
MVDWNIAPEIFSLKIAGFNLAPRWYGLSFVLGFFLGERYVSIYMVKAGFTKKDVSSLFTHVLLGTIIGARLGHCLFYEPAYYLSNPLKIPLVWEGGLASHGGFIGVMIAAWLFNRNVKKINYMWLLDLVAAPALLTGSFIRIGNLMNSEILGKPTDLPWAFIFHKAEAFPIPRHPSQLYEAIGYFTISMIGAYLYKRFHQDWAKGRFVGFILVGGMSWRFLTEFFKENQVSFENAMPINMGQLLSLFMAGLGLYLMLRKKKKEANKAASH